MYGQVYTYTVTVTFPYFIHLVEVTILGIAFVRLLVYGCSSHLEDKCLTLFTSIPRPDNPVYSVVAE